MSRFKVFVLPRAQDDVHSIFEWLNERSIEGAQNWLGQFEQMLASLAENADSFGEAEEAQDLDRPLKQCLFKTKKGRTYRAVYLMQDDRAFVLRVRGPGQPRLTADETAN